MLRLFFYLIPFLIISIVSSRTYCDECPSGCCNKYGGCPSYFQSCSCSYEKSYQIIDSGMKCKNCCDKNHCVNDLNKDVCDTVKKIQEVGKIVGAVIGGVVALVIMITFIYLCCCKKKKKVQQNLEPSNQTNIISPTNINNENVPFNQIITAKLPESPYNVNPYGNMPQVIGMIQPQTYINQTPNNFYEQKPTPSNFVQQNFVPVLYNNEEQNFNYNQMNYQGQIGNLQGENLNFGNPTGNIQDQNIYAQNNQIEMVGQGQNHVNYPPIENRQGNLNM